MKFTYSLATEAFLKRQKEIEKLHQKAFGGYPWFIEESEEKVGEEIKSIIRKPGLKSFLAYNENQEIVGVLLYDIPTESQLIEERGEALLKFTKKKMNTHKIFSFVWERDVFVDPKYHHHGIATNLREMFIEYLTKIFPKGVIILTRMWDKNPYIIQIAEKFDFKRTGITVRSTEIDAEYEYWYKILKNKD